MLLYLSATISNAHNNLHIAEILAPEINLFLPQTITPNNLNHENFPYEVYKKCLDAMIKSEAGLLLLDSYGRDCSWEAGWYSANKEKPLISYVEASSHFTRDWMIKGGIDFFITNNFRIYDYAANDPILKQKKISYIKKVEDLKYVILDYLRNYDKSI